MKQFQRPLARLLLGRVSQFIEHPLSMIIATGIGESVLVHLPGDLRDKAHANWRKHDVIVLVRGRHNSNGKLVDATALNIKPLVRHTDPVASYVSSRGALQDVWDTEEAQEYLELLRGRSN